MVSLTRILLVAFCALISTAALAAPADEVAAVCTRWKAAYDANDNVAVAKLYAEDAILHGTRSRELTIGREAITKYFTIVVGTGSKVEFGDRQTRIINDSTILVVGINDFLRNRDGKLNTEPAH